MQGLSSLTFKPGTLATLTILFWLTTIISIYLFHPEVFSTFFPVHHSLPAPFSNPGTTAPKNANFGHVYWDSDESEAWLTDSKGYHIHTHEISNGYWVPSPAHRNDTIHMGLGSKNFDCTDQPSKLVEGGFRSEDVDGWEWVLADGRRMIDWDVDAFIIRSLQSRIGVVLVGDSLTDGIFVAIHVMLGLPNPRDNSPLARTFNFGPVRWKHAKGPEVYHNNLTLHEHHPVKRRLLTRWENRDPELKNIPRWRFDQPIVRFWRNSNLASEEELAKIIVQDMGVPLDWTAQLRTLAPWREDLARYQNVPGWEGEKAGLALVSTGPHWEPARFEPIDAEHMKDAYKQVMSLIYASLSQMPANVNLRIYYRSTLPGHENCYNFNYPVTIHDKIALNPVGNENHTYHWAFFPELNDHCRLIWGAGNLSLGQKYVPKLRDFEDNTKEEERGLGIVTEYWDVWNMAVTRPDAHMVWTHNHQDCLHWCPSLYAWVARAWWHTIVTNKI